MGVCSERIQGKPHLSMGQQAHASRPTPCQHLAWRLSCHQHRRRWVTSQAYVATAVLRNEPSLTLPSYSHAQHGQICCTGASVGVWQAEQVPIAIACAYHNAPVPKPNTVPTCRFGLYNVVGNAWEWVLDRWSPRKQTAILDDATIRAEIAELDSRPAPQGSGEEAMTDEQRVKKGGSFMVRPHTNPRARACAPWM